MKNLVTICMVFLFLSACADKKSNALKKEVHTSIEKETKNQDSIAVSMKKSTKEIEKSSDKLEALLKELETIK